MEVVTQYLLRICWVWLVAQTTQPFLVTWNWGLSICDTILQIHRNIWCAYKFLNVKVISGGDIVYNSRTGPSVGEVPTLQGLVPNLFAKVIINKQDIALPTTRKFFMVPKEDFFALRKYTSLLMNLVGFVHFNVPHTNVSLRMRFFGDRS